MLIRGPSDLSASLLAKKMLRRGPPGLIVPQSRHVHSLPSSVSFSCNVPAFPKPERTRGFSSLSSTLSFPQTRFFSSSNNGREDDDESSSKFPSSSFAGLSFVTIIGGGAYIAYDQFYREDQDSSSFSIEDPTTRRKLFPPIQSSSSSSLSPSSLVNNDDDQAVTLYASAHFKPKSGKLIFSTANDTDQNAGEDAYGMYPEPLDSPSSSDSLGLRLTASSPSSSSATVSNGNFFFASVADGVGGYRKYNIDSGVLSKQLMKNCRQVAASGVTDPALVLKQAWEKIVKNKEVSGGGTTACLVSIGPVASPAASAPIETPALSSPSSSSSSSNFISNVLTTFGVQNSSNPFPLSSSTPDHPVLLRFANLGDSGVMVMRDGSIVFRSEIQQHRHNAPFQLSIKNEKSPRSISDSPSAAQTGSFPLNDGDVVLLCSDGILDNLTDSEILDTLYERPKRPTAPGAPKEPRKLRGSSRSLGLQLIQKSVETNRKPDDRTAVVIRVQLPKWAKKMQADLNKTPLITQEASMPNSQVSATAK